MKDILFVGDILLNSDVYTKDSIQVVLDNKKITYDTIRIDSLLNIERQFYIDEPVCYDSNKIDNINKYDMIVLSLYTYDLTRGYRRQHKVIDTNYTCLYEEMVSKLISKCNKLVIVIPHKHYLGEGSNIIWVENYINESHNSYVNMLKTLLTRYTFSILDLNRSINNKNINNYMHKDTMFLSKDNNYKIGVILIRIKGDINKNCIYKCMNS